MLIFRDDGDGTGVLQGRLVVQDLVADRSLPTESSPTSVRLGGSATRSTIAGNSRRRRSAPWRA